MNFSFLNLFTQVRSKSVEITLILLFVIWTPLLVNSTLEIQHSCYPLIKVSNLSRKCTDSFVPMKPICPPDAICENGNIIDFVKTHPELVAGTGAIVIAGVLAIAAAPVTLVAGIGVGSYFLLKSIVDNLH